MSELTDTQANYRSIAIDIYREAFEAYKKWGSQSNGHTRWSAIVAEEYLEAMKELNDMLNGPKEWPGNEEYERLDRLRAELLQTAAMIVRWVHFIEMEM